MVVEEAGIKDGGVPVAGDGLRDVLVEIADLAPEVEEFIIAGPVWGGQLEDGRRLDVGPHDVEPVPELDGLDLEDVPDEHEKLELGVLQDVQKICVTDCRALIDDEQVVVAGGVVLVLGDGPEG